MIPMWPTIWVYHTMVPPSSSKVATLANSWLVHFFPVCVCIRSLLCLRRGYKGNSQPSVDLYTSERPVLQSQGDIHLHFSDNIQLKGSGNQTWDQSSRKCFNNSNWKVYASPMFFQKSLGEYGRAIQYVQSQFRQGVTVPPPACGLRPGINCRGYLTRCLPRAHVLKSSSLAWPVWYGKWWRSKDMHPIRGRWN